MSLAADALANPTQAVAKLYTANKAQGIDTFPKTVTDHFRNVLTSAQIPPLDLVHPSDSFPDRSLVVFNCMVQDTSISPELYLSTLKNGGCGGWGITEDLIPGEDVAYDNLRECTTIWAVSIPGLSSWCYGESSSSAPVTGPPIQAHKYPIPDAPHIGVQIKIYDEKIGRSLRTTDLVSFTGILTTEPLHSTIDVSGPSKVPTIHVLFSNAIPEPILARNYPDPTIVPVANTLRNELIAWIADESLGGDRSTAEWVLLCAIARVRSRHPPILPLALAISNFPTHTEHPDATPTLCHILSLIFPLVTTVPLSLDALNKVQFCPESKEEDLHSGLLQLPKGTVLLINEGVVTEGGVVGKGLMNISAAQEMMQSQTLDYVFPYSSFHFETDITSIVITNGKKSTFFQTDVVVPLQYTSSNAVNETFYKSANTIKLPAAEKIQQFRQLVGGAKVGNVTIGEETGKYVEDDFVKERAASVQKENGNTTGKGLTSDDLIRRMLIARLKALSLHQRDVTIENWDSTKVLDQHSRQ